MKRSARMTMFVAIALVCVFLDQLTKAMALEHLSFGKPVTFIPGVMDLLLVKNTGAAFSLGEGAGWIFVLVAVGVVGALSAYLWRAKSVPVSLVVCSGLVAGGGIGNLIDRVCQGWVCDFFATTFVNFAVFNVADIFVCVGVFLGVVFMALEDRREEAQREARSKAAAAGVAKKLDKRDDRARLEQGRGLLNRRNGDRR